MKLRTNDGETYTISGSTITLEAATALVETMRHGSHTPSQSLEEFMQQVAHRCNLQNGSIVKTDDAEVFAKDLLRLGFLTAVEM